ncbi:MarR family transcriptional regulator [Klugiella xanthotipulae]|uniref:MarR family transcriptional regulator n=1 Tax=Klugiella xanthotipulae TaxID=244735 RepID=A0A543HYF1_9MICO|nr:MarR family winged helix-turn-helix transcriptional regulator [Klugiella xanthotipulae]TQM63300.1 MarR family transcriptional regulator [Klugiella xanthotipulae]
MTSHLQRASDTWEALFRAQVVLMRHYTARDVWGSLSPKEYDVLYTLSRGPDGGMRLHDINNSILISQPSLSRMMERLERRDLVERAPAPGDGRGVVVRLTAEGTRVRQDIGRRHARDIEDTVGEFLSDDEMDTLRALSTRLTSAMQARTHTEKSSR